MKSLQEENKELWEEMESLREENEEYEDQIQTLQKKLLEGNQLSRDNMINNVGLQNETEAAKVISDMEQEYNILLEKFKMKEHEMSNLSDQLNESQKTAIDSYYTSLANEIKIMPYKSSLIFTDGFASCRKSTVDCLTGVTDVMIFHDVI